MTTLLDRPIVSAPAYVPGAPYTSNDPITVQSCVGWLEGTVTFVKLLDRYSFGLRFEVTVLIDNSTTACVVRVDDNGRNYTRGHGVRPSSVVQA